MGLGPTSKKDTAIHSLVGTGCLEKAQIFVVVVNKGEIIFEY